MSKTIELPDGTPHTLTDAELERGEAMMARLREVEASLVDDTGQTAYSKQLLPCPFCGGSEIYAEEYEHHPGTMRWRVLCAECMGQVDTGTRQSMGQAVQDWGRRAERTCRIVVSVDRNPASYGGRVHRCSSCGKALPGALFRNGWTQLDYCPRCGARVTEVVRNAD